MTWFWDTRLLRYVNEDGGVVSRETLEVYLERIIQTVQPLLNRWAEAVANQTMTPAEFRLAMRQEIKDAYINAYTLARGGREQMTKSDWGKTGSQIADQYKYLERFTAELEEKTLSEGEIRNRAGMYLNSSREGFEAAKLRVAKLGGFDEVLWLLLPGSDHCEDCETFALMGWQQIDDDPYEGAVPGSGKTRCLTGCHCSINYRNSATGETYY